MLSIPVEINQVWLMNPRYKGLEIKSGVGYLTSVMWATLQQLCEVFQWQQKHQEKTPKNQTRTKQSKNPKTNEPKKSQTKSPHSPKNSKRVDLTRILSKI